MILKKYLKKIIFFILSGKLFDIKMCLNENLLILHVKQLKKGL